MTKRPQVSFHRPFLVGLIAWLIPGAGHVYLGRTLRGVILCVCIHGLFWSGMALGGVFTVEPLRERWWFCAQICAGFSGGLAWRGQEKRRREVCGDLGRRPVPPPEVFADGRRNPEHDRWWYTYEEELAKRDLAPAYPADIVARAYTGVAGMLNLMCIFDAFMLALLGKVGEPPPKTGGEDTSAKGAGP